MKFHPEAIERQLMHIEKDKIRKIYNKAEYLPERTVIMSVWTDYLLARKNNLKFSLTETVAKYRALLPESISEGYF